MRAVALALALVAAQDARGDDLASRAGCLPVAPMLHPGTEDWDRELTEAAWGPIPDHLEVMGGLDDYGWGRACPDGAPGRYIGEYRSRTTWYRGPLVLSEADGTPAPPGDVAGYDVSHFTEMGGFHLSPVAATPPPVRTLRLRPLDPDGFAPRP